MLDASVPLDLERLQLSPDDIERRKAFVGLQPEDVARIRSIQDIFLPRTKWGYRAGSLCITITALQKMNAQVVVPLPAPSLKAYSIHR